MTIRVMKFGGTSVASPSARRAIADRVEESLAQNERPVVVVSAMGRLGDPYATDTLLTMLPGDEASSLREKDLLMSCGETIAAVVVAGALRQRGLEPVVLTGPQAGVQTEPRYGEAAIKAVDPARIQAEGEAGRVPVVTGFQGGFGSAEITTLGRGGSDTTAAALGAALMAPSVDIYTDVDGVMTADPRIVPQARVLPRLSYQDMFQFALQGARVVHPRAVELAMQQGVSIRVGNPAESTPGTVIGAIDGSLESGRFSDRRVIGVTQQSEVARVFVRGGAHRCAEIFEGLSVRGLAVDWTSSADSGFVCVTRSGDAAGVNAVLRDYRLDGAWEEGLARVSVVGADPTDTSALAVAAGALDGAGIAMVQSGHLAHGLGVLVPEENKEDAVRALHRAFHLDEWDADDCADGIVTLSG